MSGDKKYCGGCRDNFYNGNNDMGVKQCWNLKGTSIVTRWRLHWWTPPTVPGALLEVRTNGCKNEPGQYAYFKNLPECAVRPRRLKDSA